MRLVRSGFTLLELLVSLAIVAIALVALIRLHVISLNQADHAQMMTRAVLLAQQKLEEITADAETLSTSIDGSQEDLKWQCRIIPVQNRFWKEEHGEPIRQISIDVSWEQNGKGQHYTLTGYVRDGHI